MEKAKTERIMLELCQNIGGDWLLVGGTLVQMVYDGERATEDVDLVQVSHLEKSKEVAQNELFQFTLREWGFGPELINLSAEFFVNQFKGWQAQMELLQQGPKGRVFRPSITLFCATKILRGSDLDLQDIRSALKKHSAQDLRFDLLDAWLPQAKIKLLRGMLNP